ncbi:MAG: AtpZ/AtpI family protein [Deferribacterota bacterium]|nr:AtpZ/AtpI family protein [Deferribacterota bacterium]
MMLSKRYKSLINASSVGLSIVFSILIGLAIGLYLDKLFHTKPYLTITFLIFGVLAGFKNMIYFIKRAQMTDNNDD